MPIRLPKSTLSQRRTRLPDCPTARKGAGTTWRRLIPHREGAARRAVAASSPCLHGGKRAGREPGPTAIHGGAGIGQGAGVASGRDEVSAGRRLEDRFVGFDMEAGIHEDAYWLRLDDAFSREGEWVSGWRVKRRKHRSVPSGSMVRHIVSSV